MENLMENFMKIEILKLRAETAETTIKMMQRYGKLKKRLSKKEKEELKKQFMNETAELLGNI